ncbi:MAG: lipoprotein insertase outer membrane protein LolB [Pseudomonadota bacterium]
MNKIFTATPHSLVRFFFCSIAILIGQLLSGCTSMATKDVPTTSTVPFRYQDNLFIAGRINIQYQQDMEAKSVSGTFEWLQTESETTITLLSPLGQTIAVVTQNAFGATLQQANEPVRSADDLDALLSDTLGWPLPMTSMRNWLQGYAINQQGQRAAIAAQDSRPMLADGWQLHFVSWQQEAEQIYPKRIDLQRHTTEAGEVKLRIVIVERKNP